MDVRFSPFVQDPKSLELVCGEFDDVGRPSEIAESGGEIDVLYLAEGGIPGSPFADVVVHEGFLALLRDLFRESFECVLLDSSTSDDSVSDVSADSGVRWQEKEVDFLVREVRHSGLEIALLQLDQCVGVVVEELSEDGNAVKCVRR